MAILFDQYRDLKVGDVITFRKADGTLSTDKIRGFFDHPIHLEPDAPNGNIIGCVLTDHAWCPVTDILAYISPNGESSVVNGVKGYVYSRFQD